MPLGQERASRSMIPPMGPIAYPFASGVGRQATKIGNTVGHLSLSFPGRMRKCRSNSVALARALLCDFSGGGTNDYGVTRRRG